MLPFRIIVLSFFILFILEIIFLIVYIVHIKKSKEKNTNIIERMINNLTRDNMSYFLINKYSYLLEFKRKLQYNGGGKSYERNAFLKAVTYFYIPIFILLFITSCFLCSERHKISLFLFSVCAILTFFSFIDSLIYPYKVDLPEKEIYVFDEELNDDINDLLNVKLNIKIYIVLSTIIIFVAIILQMILTVILLKRKTKNEEKEENDSILSPIIKVNNEKDPILK